MLEMSSDKCMVVLPLLTLLFLCTHAKEINANVTAESSPPASHPPPPPPHNHPPPPRSHSRPPKSPPPPPHSHSPSPTKSPPPPPHSHSRPPTKSPPPPPPSHSRPPKKTPPPPPHSHSPPKKSPPPSVPIPKSPLPPSKPSHFAVEGVVYCKSCALKNFDKKLGAGPLPGAVAVLKCNISNRVVRLGRAITDHNGYFLIGPVKGTTTTAQRCKVDVVSPVRGCRKLVFPPAPAKFIFERDETLGNDLTALFTAGFFQFGSTKPIKCPRA